MKKILFTSLAFIAFVSTAHATEIKPYVSLKGGYVKTTSSHFKFSGLTSSGEDGSQKDSFSDNTYGARFAFGAKMDSVRTELELGWNKNLSKNYSDNEENWKDSFKTKTVLLNAYYDLFTKGDLTPYIGAGIGLSHLNAQKVVKMSDNSFTWQVGAGVAYPLTDNLAFDIGYRYMDYGRTKTTVSGDVGSGKLKAKLRTNEVLAGLRYTF